MTTEWDKQTFTECVQPIRVDRGKQVKAREYLSSGKYPIVDQGQGLVAGWTDNEDAVIRDSLPYVVFGDHTRLLKYVDFPFALGADGTKLLKPKDDINPLYFYFHLLCLDIPSRGYSRHYRLLKEKAISLPPLLEQKKIAAVLLKIQRAIESQEKIIQSLRDLKKSTMQHVFTRGLRGEKTKMTKIGEIPESWEVAQISGISKERPRNGIFIKDPVWGSGLRYLNVADVYKRLVVDADRLKTVRCSHDAGKSFLLDTGDILFVRSSLKKEGIGMCCVYMEEKTDTLFDCHLIRIRLKQSRMNPIYFASYWASATGQNELIRRSKTTTMTTINQKSLAEALIPIPVKEEQEKIAEIYKNMQEKIDIHESKRDAFHDLFRTILNKLMTGKIRVADLQIDVTEVEV